LRRLPPLRSTSHLLHVQHYLHGIIFCHLFFLRSSSLHLQAYCDANWVSDTSHRRSLSAYCVFLSGSLLTWKTKKQVAVSHSSAEAELRVMTLVTTEITWLRWLLEDFGISVSMSLLSILVLMLILYDYRFRIVLLLFSMCLQSSS
jgi:hypothetical protein